MEIGTVGGDACDYYLFFADFVSSAARGCDVNGNVAYSQAYFHL